MYYCNLSCVYYASKVVLMESVCAHAMVYLEDCPCCSMAVLRAKFHIESSYCWLCIDDYMYNIISYYGYILLYLHTMVGFMLHYLSCC